MNKIGFLDQKERILDVALTDKGRELLSKNLLNFTYFAFSDDGIDYSGSLTAAQQASSSLDDYIHRNLSFEVLQKKNGKGLPTNKDIQNFLFTVPANSKVLPRFEVSLDESETLILQRRFLIDKLILNTRAINRIFNPVARVVKLTIPTETLSKRLGDYVDDQMYEKTQQLLDDGNIVYGLSVGPNLVALDRETVLDTVTGASFPLRNIDLQKLDPVFTAVGYKSEIEVVLGTDQKVVQLQLKTADGLVIPKDGFLIEVFESGSDGSLTKISQQSMKSLVDDDIKEEGFDSFLELKLDKL